LPSGPIVLYSGTLGLKHDPALLLDLALELRTTRPDARVVVVSQGKGRDWLEQALRRNDAENLILLDYQAYEDVPDVLASADILVALLEPDASRYSVPSKVLTYMCASRPIVAVMPPDNSVAQILRDSGAGIVIPPTQRDAFPATVASLLGDAYRRDSLGCAARSYAERTFSPDPIGARFEEVMASVAGGGRGDARQKEAAPASPMSAARP
jgi:glycosyltransferase involved in cell wall biosynthesis